MNLSVKEVKGEVLIISQFTIYGNYVEGRRLDFFESASAGVAQPIYEQFVTQVKNDLRIVQTGVFGVQMEASLINDGPVTFIIEKKDKSLGKILV